MGTYAGNYVDKTEPPEPGTFEIGLVMAGAISAGAYEAGVLDYLFQALDAWEYAKARTKGTELEHTVPQHKVVIKVVAAASAGSMSAAIMGVAARYDFPHLSSRELGTRGYARLTPEERKRVDDVARHNPFFKAWVQDISIEKLLTSRDLDQQDSVLQSLLDSTSLIEITRECLNYEGSRVVDRPYLANPTRYIFSIANLRGIPYFFSLGSEEKVGLGMSLHRDHRSFTINYAHGENARVIKGDDIALDWSPDSADKWRTFGWTALASGAFPVGLAPRPMNRLSSDYQYRFVVLPATDDEPARAVQLKPNALRMPPTDFKTFLVDGGTMNNEPVDLARQELAGLTSRNKRKGIDANRCILMIDPFPDTEAQDAEEPAGMTPVLTSVIGNLVGAWKNQARFSPQDLALAADEEIYSRFLIAPSRGDAQPKGLTLACGALGGFSGFCSRDFRQHDYLLGRRNAQKFLSHVFTLPAGNDLFKNLPAELKHKGGKWARAGTQGVELPIIPLMDDLLPAALSGNLTHGYEEALSDWPSRAFRVESIEDAIKQRMEKLINHAIDNTNFGWFKKYAGKALLALFKGDMSDKIMAQLRQGLAAGGLNPGPDVPKTRPAPAKDWFAKIDPEL